MSHYTTFKFDYTNEECIRKTFQNLGLECKQVRVRTFKGVKWREDEYAIYDKGSICPALVAKNANGFNYLMEHKGNHYELSMEKHNMNLGEAKYASELASEFQKNYIEEVAQSFVDQMSLQGTNCLLNKEENGCVIRFGSMYEKSISIKFENGRVIEEVQGVKGAGCKSITEALENMLSSDSANLNTEWTSEYYEDSGDGLALYNLEQF